MSAPQPLDLDTALSRLESVLAGAPAVSAPEGLDPDVLRALCLVPAWTPVLAERCGLPSLAGADAPALDACRREGVVEVTQTPLTIDDTGVVTPAQHLLWMPRHTRSRWLARLIADEGRDRLASAARDLAQRVLQQPQDQHLPSATWRWATLTAQATQVPSVLERGFTRELDAALADGRPEDAWLWIEALQRVADVMPGQATTLHQRAVRRLALSDRERNDRAILHDYLPRPALFEAYHALLTGPDDEWGLHYLGGGGVGKTMLMRALTSGTSSHWPPGFTMPPTVTARIDFDHINPDYPARRPGLLFAHLAEELRLKDDGLRASEAFGLLFSRIGLLHERPSGEATTDHEIDDIIEVFAWACEALTSARSARVVLLLDTCEELARLGPDGTLPDSVARTFALLERLHDRVPSLRVVLCGRRPLAGTYAAGDTVDVLLPPRPWLRLHRVFAFSEEEGREYLARSGVPESLVPAVLARSVAAASSAAIGLPAEHHITRVSPFSLSVYAAWIAREQVTDPEAILADRTDHFLHIRILDRIHNPDVRRLLPVVALLGRFDEATLRACAGLDADGSDTVIREIGSQEWVDRQPGGYLAVEPELRARLLAMFEREQPRDLHEARQRALPVLWRLFEDVVAPGLPDESVVQALVALVHGDSDALGHVATRLDGLVTGQDESAWGLRVLGRLLADDGPIGRDRVDGWAWGALLTTYAECVLREHGLPQTADLWPRAWDAASASPSSPSRQALLVRIASGALAAEASAYGVSEALDTRAVRLYELVASASAPSGLDEAPRLAAIAAVMACTDAAERQRDVTRPGSPMVGRIASAVLDVADPLARAVALTCLGRLARRRQDVDVAHKRLLDALGTCEREPRREPIRSLHWPRGFDAVSWTTVTALVGLVGLEPVADTLDRVVATPAVRDEVAANRLDGLRRRLESTTRLPEPGPGEGVPGVEAADVAAPQLGAAALVVAPPRALAVATELVESGHPDIGLRLMAELTSHALSARNIDVSIAVEEERASAAARMRLVEDGRIARLLGVGPGGVSMDTRNRLLAFRPTGITAEPEQYVVTTRADAHAIWRGLLAIGTQAQTDAAQFGGHLLTQQAEQDEGDWVRASLALDLVECVEMGLEASRVPQGLSPASPEDWWHRHPGLPEQALRLWVRSVALGIASGGPTSALVRRVGVRRAAVLAMEEGELLALRLPALALHLIALALTWYEDAHDDFGVWQVATLLALTRVRAGVAREDLDLAGLEAAHGRLHLRSLPNRWRDAGVDQESQPLPRWRALEAITELPIADRSIASEWLPWLHRIVALQHWVQRGVRPEVLFTTPLELVPVELRGWPSTVAGGATGTQYTLGHDSEAPRTAPAPSPMPGRRPGESLEQLSGSGASRPGPVPSPPAGMPPPAPTTPWASPTSLPRAESSSVPVDVPVPTAPPTREERGVRLAWTVIGVAATVLVALGIAALWTRVQVPPPVIVAQLPPEPGESPGLTGEGPGLSTVTGDASTSAVGIAVVVLLPALAAGAWLFYRRQRVEIVEPEPVPIWSARVSPTGTPATAGVLHTLDVLVSLADQEGVEIVAAPLRVRRTDAFASLDALRQPPAGTVLSAPVTAHDVEHVRLDVTAATAWPCWEAWIWSGQVHHARLTPTVVRRVRSLRTPRDVHTPLGAPWPIVTISASAADDRQSAYAWEPSLRAGRATLSTVAAETVRSGLPLLGVRLVHVTAQPVETVQGLFLEASGHEGPAVKESLESLAHDRGTLVEGVQIAHTFPDATCVLLQPPRRPTLDLTPAGRETCAHLRLVGASLAEQGVPLVIVLPPLDGELATHLVRLLGRRVPVRRDGRLLDPHEFQARAREIIFRHAESLLPRDAAIELALQLTLYTP